MNDRTRALQWSESCHRSKAVPLCIGCGLVLALLWSAAAVIPMYIAGILLLADPLIALGSRRSQSTKQALTECQKRVVELNGQIEELTQARDFACASRDVARAASQ